MQDELTEARIQAERAIAGAMQQDTAATGLSEWADQRVNISQGAFSTIAMPFEWFGGVELSPASSQVPTSVSLDIQALATGVELVKVPFY